MYRRKLRVEVTVDIDFLAKVYTRAWKKRVVFLSAINVMCVLKLEHHHNVPVMML